MNQHFFDLIVAFIGGACFVVVYRIPRRFFWHATSLGMMAKLGFEFLRPFAHISFVTFCVTFGVASMSHLFARRTGKPAQAFLIPGVIFLVPGIHIYYGFSSAFAKEFTRMTEHFLVAFYVTGGISFALLLANWAVPSKKML